MPMKFPSFRPRREAFPETMWTQLSLLRGDAVQQAARARSMRVCPSCGHHFRLPAPVRLGQLLDDGHVRRARRRPHLGGPARRSSTRSRTRTGSRPPSSPRGCATPRSGASAASSGQRDRDPASWTSGSWAARWAPSSARRSPGPPRARSRSACRSSSCPRRAGRGCRRARWRSCSWPRRWARWSGSARPASPTSPSCPTRRPAASSPRTRSSATSTSPSPTR